MRPPRNQNKVFRPVAGPYENTPPRGREDEGQKWGDWLYYWALITFAFLAVCLGAVAVGFVIADWQNGRTIKSDVESLLPATLSGDYQIKLGEKPQDVVTLAIVDEVSGAPVITPDFDAVLALFKGEPKGDCVAFCVDLLKPSSECGDGSFVRTCKECPKISEELEDKCVSVPPTLCEENGGIVQCLNECGACVAPSPPAETYCVTREKCSELGF